MSFLSTQVHQGIIPVCTNVAPFKLSSLPKVSVSRAIVGCCKELNCEFANMPIVPLRLRRARFGETWLTLRSCLKTQFRQVELLI